MRYLHKLVQAFMPVVKSYAAGRAHNAIHITTKMRVLAVS